MVNLLDIIFASIMITVVNSGWNEYTQELHSLQFQNSSALKEFMQQLHTISMSEIPAKNVFPCESHGLVEQAVSVHQLRPADIKVIGAMGDSLTAGNGVLADTFIGSLIENRGYSWDVGGESSYENNSRTVPNILKHYNPDLTGYSLGTGLRKSKVARCNVAQPGNVARDMPGQADMLIERLKTLEGSSFQDDWKLITIFIGGNDLCDYCKDPALYSAANYAKFIAEALDKLAAEVPKAFINVVGPIDVSSLVELEGGLVCQLLQWKLCSCVLDVKTRPQVKEMVMEYTHSLEDLLTSGRYDTRDDFTVVSQPILKDKEIPRSDSGEGDLSYFAHDCIHFNLKGHNAMATILWNSMFQPVGNKSTEASFTDELYCPKKYEPFATAKNSQDFEDRDFMDKKLRANEVEDLTGDTQGRNQDGGRSNVDIKDGGNKVFGLMVLAVATVTVLGYGTFFMVHWSVKTFKCVRHTSENSLSRNLIANDNHQSHSNYQTI